VYIAWKYLRNILRILGYLRKKNEKIEKKEQQRYIKNKSSFFIILYLQCYYYPSNVSQINISAGQLYKYTLEKIFSNVHMYNIKKSEK